MTTTAPAERRSRAIRALLAGGLILGIGATVTLAAWTDNEFAAATFSSGRFNVQASSTSASSGYSDHDSSGNAAPLTFTAPFSNLSPGDTVYAPFWVRLAANTTSAATLDLVSLDSTDTTGSNSANLSYAVYAIAAGATCNASASGTLVGSAPTLADAASIAGATPPLPTGAPVSDPGAATQLCFVITAGPSLSQGGVTSATWRFTATSA